MVKISWGDFCLLPGDDIFLDDFRYFIQYDDRFNKYVIQGQNIFSTKMYLLPQKIFSSSINVQISPRKISRSFCSRQTWNIDTQGWQKKIYYRFISFWNSKVKIYFKHILYPILYSCLIFRTSLLIGPVVTMMKYSQKMQKIEKSIRFLAKSFKISKGINYTVQLYQIYSIKFIERLRE